MQNNYYYKADIPLPHFPDQGSLVTLPASVLEESEIHVARIPGTDLIRGVLALDTETLQPADCQTLLKNLAHDHPDCEVVRYEGSVLRPTGNEMDPDDKFHLMYSQASDQPGTALLGVADGMVDKPLLLFEADTTRSGRVSYILVSAENEDMSRHLPLVIAAMLSAGGIRGRDRYNVWPEFLGLTASHTIPKTQLTDQPTAYQARLIFDERSEATVRQRKGKVLKPLASMPERFYQSLVFALCQPGVFLAIGDFVLFMHAGPLQAAMSFTCGLLGSALSLKNSWPFLRDIWHGRVRAKNPIRLMDKMWITASQWVPQLVPEQLQDFRLGVFLGKHADLVLAAVGAFGCGFISMGQGIVGGLDVATLAPTVMGAMFGSGTLIGAIRVHLKTDEPFSKMFRQGLMKRFVRWLDKSSSFQRKIFRFVTNPTALLGMGYLGAGVFGLTGFGVRDLFTHFSPQSVLELASLAVSAISTTVITSRIISRKTGKHPFSQGREQMNMAGGVILPLTLAALAANPVAAVGLFCHFWGETMYGVSESVAAPYERIGNRLEARAALERRRGDLGPGSGTGPSNAPGLAVSVSDSSGRSEPDLKTDPPTSLSSGFSNVCRTVCNRLAGPLSASRSFLRRRIIQLAR